MINSAKFTVIAAILITVGIARAQNDSSSCLCYTGNASAKAGAPFSVGLYINNPDSLAGLQIPIFYRSWEVDLRCDSVTFSGSRCEDFSILDAKIDRPEKIVNLIIADTHGGALAPGKGLLAKLWFSTGKTAKPGKVELYSGPNAKIPDAYIDFNYLFWLVNAQQINCDYDQGLIEIK